MTADDRAKHLASLFNEVFELALDWTEDGFTSEVNIDDIVLLARNMKELSLLLKDKGFERAVWSLTQSKIETSVVLDSPELMSHIIITDGERIELAKSLLSSDDEYKLITVGRIGSFSNRHTFQKVGPFLDIVMPRFYQAEEQLLKESGFNQSSIAIIISAIRRHESQIRKNLAEYRTVRNDRLSNSVDMLGRLAENMNSVATKLRDAGRQVTPMIGGVMKSKSKVIGLATLWGDAVPLLICRDWGIASVISTAAGATIAAILPAGSRPANHPADVSHQD